MSGVKENRHLYIGGSDIPVIMGISKFKSRYDLLLEKAQIKTDDFEGNAYTDYGNRMEPVIRDYVNKKYGTNFGVGEIVDGDLRGHFDGINETAVLEVKTTSAIHATVEEYKDYLVQLLFYLALSNRPWGLLCVYDRPKDFSLDFDPDRLQAFEVCGADYADLTRDIFDAIAVFREDLNRLKANPLLCEDDFQPPEIITAAQQILSLEKELKELKAVELQVKQLKALLYASMTEHNVKSWKMPSGVTVTRVDAIPDTEESVCIFDEDRFKKENPEYYALYTKEETRQKKGQSRLCTNNRAQGMTTA